MNCVFCSIANHEIDKVFTYEDNDVMVFPDIHPVKPVHLLIVPKEHIATFSHLENDKLLVKIRKVIQKMIRKAELEGKGYKIAINGGGLQIIDHLHLHLTGPYKNL